MPRLTPGPIVIGLALAVCAAGGSWHLTNRPSKQPELPSVEISLPWMDVQPRRALEGSERRERPQPPGPRPSDTHPPFLDPHPRVIDTHPLEHLRGSPLYQEVLRFGR